MKQFEQLARSLKKQGMGTDAYTTTSCRIRPLGMKPFLDPSKTEPKKAIDDTFDADELAFLFSNHQTILAKRQHFDVDEQQVPKTAGQPDYPSQGQTADSAIPGACRNKGLSNDESLEGAELSDNATESEDEREDLQLDEYLYNEDLYETGDEQPEIISVVEEEFDPESLVSETGLDFVGSDLDFAPTEEEGAVDWTLLLDTEHEFDPELTGLLDETEVEIGGALTGDERALQMAIFLGDQYDELDRGEILLIAEIFATNGWSACKTAILRELTEGTTVDELYLASQVKELWKEHYEFYSGQVSNFRVLSWPTALCIIRSFDGYPDPEEIEQMLVRLHDHWRNDDIQRRISTTFNEYIIGKFCHGEELSEFFSELVVDSCSSLDDLELLPPSSEDIPELTFDQRGYILKTIRNIDR